MGVSLALFHLAVLLAAGNNGKDPSKLKPKTNPRRSSASVRRAPSDEQTSNSHGRKGRQRYAPLPGSPKGSGKRSRNRGYQDSSTATDKQQPEETIFPEVPPMTGPSGPFPTYFTCRHTFEDTLIEELNRYTPDESSIRATSSSPGLVYVEGLPFDTSPTKLGSMMVHDNFHLENPVYALQALPNCRIVHHINSIKGLARDIAELPEFCTLLAQSPRGALASIHAIVPGMCKGQKDPIWHRRSHLVADAILDIWKKQFPAARKKAEGVKKEPSTIELDNQLLLQVLLLSPDAAAVSLTPCHSPALQSAALDWQGPNLNYPVGMALVDITTQKMPSSAYRKLLEAISYWGTQPSEGDTVIDLGASPGGWTSALLLQCDKTARTSAAGIHIVAVDRSPLDPKLMKDPRVTFVQGDAFTYEPLKPVAWMMVSDIIAYPERIVELVNHWCRDKLARNMIITMKFQDMPSWEHLDQALQVAQSHQYMAQAKHFFNNKNEVTLMLRQESSDNLLPSRVRRIPPFYKPVI